MKQTLLIYTLIILSITTTAQVNFSPVVHSAFNQPGITDCHAPFICKDFNNDGKPDFLRSSHNDSCIALYLGDGNGRFSIKSKIFKQEQYTVKGCGYYLVSADFNNDGNLDFGAITDYDEQNEDSVDIYVGDGKGDFSYHNKFHVGDESGFYPLIAMDFNNDNKIDLLGRTYWSDSIVVLYGDGMANFNNRTTSPFNRNSAEFSTILPIEINNDSFTDIIITHYESFSVVKNSNGIFTIDSNFSTPYGNNSIEVKDFNNDGYDDIACISSDWGGSSLMVYLNTQTGQYTLTNTYTLNYGDARILATDFNKDGLVDIGYTIGYGVTDSIGILNGDGEGSFLKFDNRKYAINGKTYYHNVNQCVDINGDGNTDIITSGMDEGRQTDGVNVMVNNAEQKGVDYYPNRGGNGGDVTVRFLGAIIQRGMKMKLVAQGKDPIVAPDSMIFYAGNHQMNVVLDLRDKELGLYDIILTDTNGNTHVIPQGFTIEPFVEPKLWVNITGDPILRVGFKQVYTVTYGNTGNVDAYLPALLIQGLPAGTDIEILNPTYRVDKFPGFDTLNYSQDTINHTLTDSASGKCYRLFYLSKVDAQNTGTLTFIFHLPNDAVLGEQLNIEAIIGTPINENSDLSHVYAKKTGSAPINGEMINCFNSLMLLSADIFGDFLGFNDIEKCVIGVGGVAHSMLNEIYYKDNNSTKAGTIIDAVDNFKGGWELAADCMSAAANFIPATKFYKIFKAVEKTTTKAKKGIDKIKDFDKVDGALGSRDAFYNCTKPEDKSSTKPVTGNSWDPNEKYGPGDSTNPFLNNSKPISYTINFENDPNANLNAQTITVTDSLNADYYDYSTFAFTSVVFSDSIYVLPYPSKSFTHEFDFTALYGVKARVTAVFDITTGIAQWEFSSIDPATNMKTTNALLGILPPDTLAPLGQGHVSFIVKPAKNVGNNSAICNKATIVFDSNPPIHTKCWGNIFDMESPSSKVDSLPATISTEQFSVSWTGNDNLSGVKEYDVYVSVNDSAYTLWKSGISVTSAEFIGVAGNTYSFYSIATDKAGNREGAKELAETSITIIEHELRIYPNPSNGQFVIHTRQGIEIKEVEVFDMQGRIMNSNFIKEKENYARVHFSNTTSLNTFIVRIITSNKTYNEKIMIR